MRQGHEQVDAQRNDQAALVGALISPLRLFFIERHTSQKAAEAWHMKPSPMLRKTSRAPG
jgi:hypothetical protein